MRQFDFLIFVGRFEPPHTTHLAILKRAFALAEHVIVILGSHDKPRSIQNPWTTDERIVMLRHCLGDAERARTSFVPVRDQLYNDEQWVTGVQKAVAERGRAHGDRGGESRHHRPQQGRELLLPEDVPAVDAGRCGEPRRALVDRGAPRALRERTDRRGRSNDRIRRGDGGNLMLVESAVPSAVFAYLKAFREAPAFAQLVREHYYIKRYRAG